MSSQFFGLNIAYTGLQAANAALNTTANNISNVETEGYSRQQTVQQATDALHTWATYGMAGSGVDTIEIQQVRNQYYDLKYWTNNADLGAYDVKQYYMKQIEDYFTETDVKEGFGTIYNDMFSALEEVYKSPGDDTVKAQFLSSAQSLCEYFGAMSTNLEKIQLDANTEIKNKVDEINSIASQITTLNKQINTIEITGAKANELRDKRALLIDQLSKIVDVSVTEVPVYVAAGSDVESGIYKFYVDIAGGQSLVDGYEYNTLECVARENKLNQSDAVGLYDIRWSNDLEFNLYGKNLGGELKGLVEIRDGNNEEYFHGTSDATSGTGTFKDSNGAEIIDPETGSPKEFVTVSVKVTEGYLKDMNKTTIPEKGTLTLNSKDCSYIGWEYDSNTSTYTFYMEEDPGAGSLGKEASVGRAIDYQGIPYYMEQMNEWVRTFSKAANEIEKTAQDSEGKDGNVLFKGADLVNKDNEFSFSDYDPMATTWSSNQDNYYKLTAANYVVNNEMVVDVNKFGTTADIHQGQDAQDITEKLLNIRDEKGIRGCTTKEFLQTILSDIALSASSANTFQSVYSDVSRAIVNQRMSVSAVDNDEEALNLTKFQEAYNLSAKMIQVFTEIYDRLILNTGV